MIVIVGCGFVGARLGDHLHACGQAVCGITRSEASAEELSQGRGWPVIAGDVSTREGTKAIHAALPPGDVSAVIHCASSGRGGAEAYQRVYVDGMKHLVQTFPEAYSIFTSSTSVYAQTDGSVVTEESAAEPGKETGRLLLQAESIALEAGGAVARLAGIYGPGRSFVLKNLLLGKAAIETRDGLGGEGRYLNQIHAADAASALAHLVGKRLSGIFNVVDDSPIPQRECLTELADRFSLPLPKTRPPDPNRKRGWTHKAVSNAKLRATGWSPGFSDYFSALKRDPDLVSSILIQIQREQPEAEIAKAPNITLIGLMGSGKTTVGKLIARKLGWDFVDTDAALVEQAGGLSIPEIFATEGESGFRDRESRVLSSLVGCRNTVIATGGGIILRSQNRALLGHLGFNVWLAADPQWLAKRTAHNQDRPLLNQGNHEQKLRELLQEREPLYKSLADLCIPTEDLNPEESAYGATESARVFFMQQLRRQCARHAES